MFVCSLTCTNVRSVVHLFERSDHAAVYESVYSTEFLYNVCPYVTAVCVTGNEWVTCVCSC